MTRYLPLFHGHAFRLKPDIKYTLSSNLAFFVGQAVETGVIRYHECSLPGLTSRHELSNKLIILLEGAVEYDSAVFPDANELSLFLIVSNKPELASECQT